MRFLVTKTFWLKAIKIRSKHQKVLVCRSELLISLTSQTILRSSNTGFVEKLAKALLFADIPLYKLNDKHIKNLFHNIGHSLSSENTCRKTGLQLSVDELKRIRNAVYNKQTFLVIDERSLSGMHLNIPVGNLETPDVSQFYNCQSPAFVVNSKSNAQVVGDAVTSLGINKNCFCFLLCDAAKYMMVAGAILKLGLFRISGNYPVSGDY